MKNRGVTPLGGASGRRNAPTQGAPRPPRPVLAQGLAGRSGAPRQTVANPRMTARWPRRALCRAPFRGAAGLLRPLLLPLLRVLQVLELFLRRELHAAALARVLADRELQVHGQLA